MAQEEEKKRKKKGDAKTHDEVKADEKVDEAIDESFPASDPPPAYRAEAPNALPPTQQPDMGRGGGPPLP